MRRGAAIGIAAAVVVLAVGAWYVFVRDDAPAELSLEGAVADVVGTTEGSAASSTTAGTQPSSTVAASSTTTPPDAAAALDGTWTIDQANTVVGYRIGEELSGIGTTEAVGRTSDVTGALALSGTVIEAVDIEVDMTTLRSNSDSRDNQLRTRGLETDLFPVASFSLTEPIALGAEPAPGETINATASGDLTLHGVTRSVEVPLEGTIVDDTIVVVGSLEVLLADYDIDAPVGFRVLTIEEQGVFELQLAFTR